MFKEALIWLRSGGSEFTLMNQTVTLRECQRAIEDALQQFQTEFRTFQGLRLSPNKPSATQLSVHSAELTFLQFYLASLEKFEASLQLDQSQSIFKLLLDLTTVDDALLEKALVLFDAWLRQDSATALQFYDQFIENVCLKVRHATPLGRAAIQLGQQALSYHLKQLRTAFQFQTEPRGLARCLTGTVLGDLPRWGACIIWLLERGVSVEQILQMGVLQKFLGYNFNSLNSRHCPDSMNVVSLFYNILMQFEQASDLVDSVDRFSCDVRGHSEYNLRGQRMEQEVPVMVDENFPLLTRTPENILQLITCFGQDALIESVQSLFHCSQADEFDKFLKAHIQTNPHSITPTLINRIVSEPSVDLRKWAYLMDDAIFQSWLDRNEVTILYLLPHRAEWAAKVTVPRIKAFMRHIRDVVVPGTEHESLRLLMCLYGVVSTRNVTLLESVYDTMLNFILEKPYLLEDQQLFQLLQLAPCKVKCLDEKITELCGDLQHAVRDFISQPITEENLSVLMRRWQKLKAAVDSLQSLKKYDGRFPNDRLALMIYVFQQQALCDNPSWDPLIDIFQLRPEHPEPLDAPKLRVIYSLLTQVQHDQLRDWLIETFDIRVSVLHVKHRELLREGIAAGNIGLLDWFLREGTLNEAMIRQAMRSKQCALLEHWFVNYRLPDVSPELVDQLLVNMSDAGQFNFLRRLIRDYNFSFSTAAITEAYAVASSHDDPRTLYVLYKLRPSTMAHKLAFSKAIEGESENSVRFFQGIKKPQPHLAFEVIRTFNQAVKDNNLKLTASLLKFSVNAPPRKLIQRAMEKARGNGQAAMVALLHHALHPSSSREVPNVGVHPDAGRVAVRPIQSFCSTDSLSHLSGFGSPLRSRPPESQDEPVSVRAVVSSDM
jgi:hypothetical protein